jgi:hypothetical protein
MSRDDFMEVKYHVLGILLNHRVNMVFLEVKRNSVAHQGLIMRLCNFAAMEIPCFRALNKSQDKHGISGYETESCCSTGISNETV